MQKDSFQLREINSSVASAKYIYNVHSFTVDIIRREGAKLANFTASAEGQKISDSQSKSSGIQYKRIRTSLASSTKILRTLQMENYRFLKESAERKIHIPPVDNTILRKNLINRCECVVYDILEQLCAGEMPKISYRIPTADTLTHLVESLESDSWSSQNDVDVAEDFDGHTSTIFEIPESMESDILDISEPRNVVDFGRKQSKRKFALMMTVMARIHCLLLINKTETRRSLFYELKSDKNTSAMVNSQEYINDTVNCVANLLECSPWDTGLVTTAKGLAAGDLTLCFENDKVIDYNVSGGALIPHNVSNLISSKSKANRVLVVEKDTIFQKLLQEKCPSELNCILVTGKGYPDVPTRMLVKILAEKVGLPVYILVDADPHGLEIMLTYKYGSIKYCRDQGSLACPSARWIGVYPSEFIVFNDSKLALNNFDVAKLESLRSRRFVCSRFAEELDIMMTGKMEIEAIPSLTSMYLRMKFMAEDYV